MPYEVLKRTKKEGVLGLQMGDKHQHRFREGTSFRLPDSEARQAEDIKQRFGQKRTDGEEADVLVVQIPDRSPDRIVTTGIGPGRWDEIREEQRKAREAK